jgi:hypothetical protein
MNGVVEIYISNQLVKKRESRAFSEVDLVGNAGFFDGGQAKLVVFSVDVHGQDLQQ